MLRAPWYFTQIFGISFHPQDRVSLAWVRQQHIFSNSSITLHGKAQRRKGCSKNVQWAGWILRHTWVSLLLHAGNRGSLKDMRTIQLNWECFQEDWNLKFVIQSHPILVSTSMPPVVRRTMTRMEESLLLTHSWGYTLYTGRLATGAAHGYRSLLMFLHIRKTRSSNSIPSNLPSPARVYLLKQRFSTSGSWLLRGPTALSQGVGRWALTTIRKHRHLHYDS